MALLLTILWSTWLTIHAANLMEIGKWICLPVSLSCKMEHIAYCPSLGVCDDWWLDLLVVTAATAALGSFLVHTLSLSVSTESVILCVRALAQTALFSLLFLTESLGGCFEFLSILEPCVFSYMELHAMLVLQGWLPLLSNVDCCFLSVVLVHLLSPKGMVGSFAVTFTVLCTCVLCVVG